jgi:hypothetical protein
MKVYNMTSPRGNKVPNQFIIEHGGFTYFQSYQTIITRKHHKTGTITLDRDMWDYSVTTLKYLNSFLGHNTKETRRRIKAGVYKLANLNK